MKNLFLIFTLFMGSTVLYSNINEIPVYPSGIKVSFLAPPLGRAPEPIDLSGLSYWERVKTRKAMKRLEAIAEEKAKQPTPMRRFIRVINSVSLQSGEQVALVFFNQDDEMIEHHIIEKSPKPSPANVFYMDRNTGRQFSGLLDVYHIPEDSVSMTVAVMNGKKVKTLSTHPAYSLNKKLPIDDYNKVGGNSKIMLQFEVLGDSNKMLTRIAAFRFF